MPEPDATYDILIAIRDRLDGLDKAVRGLKGVGGALDEANAKASRLGETFKAVFGANLAERAMQGLLGAVKDAALAQFSLAGEIRDTAQSLEMSARGYQVYSQLVRDAGGNVGALRQGVTRLNQSLVEARDVSSGAAAAFEKLGLDPAAMEAMDTEQQIEALAKAVMASEDRLGAFNALGKILGERTLPALRAALQEVAAEGYEPLARRMEAANRIMSDSEIASLDDAAKAVERKKLQATVLAGRGTGATLSAVAGAQSLDAPSARPDAAATKRIREAALEVRKLRDALEEAARAQTLLEGDPAKGEETRRLAAHSFAVQQVQTLRALHALRNDLALQPLAGDETMSQRTKELNELNAQIGEFINLRNRAAGVAPSALDELRFRALRQDNSRVNPNALDAASGVQAGALQWLESVGSKGEQVAAVVQNGLGGALDAVAAKLAGADVQSWGEMWRGVLRALLQDFIKLTLQMQLMRALIGIFGTPGVPAAAGGGVPALGGGQAFNPLAGAVPFTMPGRATGGDVQVGQAYSVNEKGYPEVFIPSVPGRISPSAVTLDGRSGGRGRTGGSGGIVVHQLIHVSTGVQETVRAEMVGMLPALRASSVDALRDAIARNEIQL